MTATTELKTAATKLDIAVIAERYASAWIAHDPAGVLALHAPHSTFQAHGRTSAIRGVDVVEVD